MALTPALAGVEGLLAVMELAAGESVMTDEL